MGRDPFIKMQPNEFEQKVSSSATSTLSDTGMTNANREQLNEDANDELLIDGMTCEFVSLWI